MRIKNRISKMVSNAIKTNPMGKAAMGIIALLSMASCQDWLTIYPQTQIVEENFWEDKNDLEGVRYAAYKSMCGTLEKMVLWGDLRSDTYVLSSADQNTGTQNFYNELREGRLERDSDNAYFKWDGFYTTINYCNKVLYHGPEVLENDKQFATSEWNQMRAEMVALRALNYFYLIRAFKDVPYTTKVINRDADVEYFYATNQLVVLDSLIADVESVQGLATNRFSNVKDTKGLMTNSAIYAMLSDMYLWRASLHQGRDISTDTVVINNVINKARIKNLTERNDSAFVIHTIEGDYQLAVDYADLAMAKLNEQNLLNNQGLGGTDEKINYGLENCEMYKNDFRDFQQGGRVKIPAYDEVFTKGNSEESIFELQFSKEDERGNSVVTSQWGYSTSVHLAVSEAAIDKIYGSIKKDHDARVIISAFNRWSQESSDLPGRYCFKWRGASIVVPENGRIDNPQLKVSTQSDNDGYRNWIIYRLSDVMLQKAEALAVLAQFGKKESDPQAQEARRIVNALHRRWYCPESAPGYNTTPSESVLGKDGYAWASSSDNSTIGNIPQPAAPSTTEATEIAVMNERQIEFIAEGKRWFDLVRLAERHSAGKKNDGTQDPREWTPSKPITNGKVGVDYIIDNFMINTMSSTVCASLKNHMKNRYGLYNLIHYMEIKASIDNDGVPHLEQNPVWNKSMYD